MPRVPWSAMLMLIIAALAASAALSSSYAADPAPRAAARDTRARVRAVAAQPAPATQAHTFTARVRAASGPALAFTTGGRLSGREVEVGDEVKRGQRVATLDAAPLRNAQRAAEAQLRQLMAQHDQLARDVARADALQRASAGSMEALERVSAQRAGLEAALEAARVQRDEARRQVSEATLRAPYDGVITATMLDAGDVAAPGQPVLSIGPSAPALELELMVPEALIARVTPGLTATISAPLAKLPPLTTTLTSVASHAAPGVGLFLARLEIPHAASWRPGLTATVTLSLPAEPGWLVPLSAVVSPAGDQPSVVCVREGLAQPLPVQLIAIRDEGAVVRGALNPDEQVVTAGHFAIQPGAPVEVAP